jgi:hypothetical protein
MQCAAARTLVALCAVSFAAACAEHPTELVLDFDSLSFKVASGDGQVGLVGEELPDPLVVQVKMQGKPVEDVLVNFRVVEGDGSMYAGASITNEDGKAQDYWTLGPEPGENVVEVRAVHPGSGEKYMFGRFTATGVYDGPDIRVPEDFLTIQEAINASDDGDEILVNAGSYEGATIDRSVTLIGMQAHIVAPDQARLSEIRRGAFYIRAHDVTVEGFTFESDYPEGPDDQNFYAAIVMEDAAGATIRNNVFIAAIAVDKHPLYEGGPDAPMIECDISDNTFFADHVWPQGDGNLALFINLHNGDRDNTISDNVFTSSGLGFGSAVTFWCAGDADVSGNRIKGNTFQLTGEGQYVAGIGIWWDWEGALTPPTGNEITNNDFTESAQGLSLQIGGMEQPEEARALILEGNVFENNKGLDLDDICPGWEECGS